MSTGLISIIVPIYKVEDYLAKCVDSILYQTYCDIEVILVDDGSPDRCPLMCDEYALRDSRVKVIHKENGGLSSARNAGLDIASGNYIGFVDSDDWIASDMYETMLDNMRKHSSDLVICGTYYVYEDCNIIHKETPAQEAWDSDEALELFLTGKLFTVMACDKLYKHNLFDHLRFPKGKLHEDEFIMHEIYGISRKISFLNAAKYYYRQRTNSIMGVRGAQSLLNTYEAYRSRFDYIKQRNPKLLPYAAVPLLEYEVFLHNLKRANLSVEEMSYLTALEAYRDDFNNINPSAVVKEMPLKSYFKAHLKNVMFSLHPSVYINFMNALRKLRKIAGFLYKFMCQ